VDNLNEDKYQLERFVTWISGRDFKDNSVAIMFIPWGEALIHSWYQKALSELSHLRIVDKVVIQTNLSCSLQWLDKLDPEKIALWTTYHPSQVGIEEFISKVGYLREKGINFSVGCVGKKEFKNYILALKNRLSDPKLGKVYTWVNAFKNEGNDYYTSEDVEFFNSIDKYFNINLNNYNSFGKECRAGKSVFFIEGNGDIRRCNFDDNILGNIYKNDLDQLVCDSKCRQRVCDCYIGYINLVGLNLNAIYGGRILERVPMEIG